MNLRLLVVVLDLQSLLVVRDVLLGPLGVRGADQLLLAKSLFVITYKYRDQSARMHKTGSKEIQLTTMPILTCRS